MRELKVRAWHKPYKQMCQVESLRFDGNGVYTAVLIEEPFYDRKLVEADEIVIEQFTGLKDRNGTDIYEGDIIQFEFWNEKYYRQIAYNSAIASYEAITVASPTSKKLRQKAKYSFSELYKISSKGFKVVGNIHENPELVEEK